MDDNEKPAVRGAQSVDRFLEIKAQEIKTFGQRLSIVISFDGDFHIKSAARGEAEANFINRF